MAILSRIRVFSSANILMVWDSSSIFSLSSSTTSCLTINAEVISGAGIFWTVLPIFSVFMTDSLPCLLMYFFSVVSLESCSSDDLIRLTVLWETPTHSAICLFDHVFVSSSPNMARMMFLKSSWFKRKPRLELAFHEYFLASCCVPFSTSASIDALALALVAK